MRFSINTLGCKVNLCESDEISGLLSAAGLQQVDCNSGDPHLCIVNTCTVTSESDRKVRQLIRRIKKTNSRAKLVVTGCYVKDHYDFLKKNGADLILDNDRKRDISGMVKDILGIAFNDDEIEGLPATCTDHRERHSRPIVKVQDGCEQNCSYCIIPGVRGGYKSMESRSILEKINRIVGEGFEEVVLTGIHIGKYGAGIEGSRGLKGLISEILSASEIKRIRISSLEINEIDDGLIDVIRKYSERIAPHLHIPLQSGSDRILEKMGRPYSSGYFMEIIKKVRKNIPDITFTTDIIAGFPGETENDFKKTYNMVEDMDLSKLHIFKYSPRPGTKAFIFQDMLPAKVKDERSFLLRQLGGRMRESFLEGNIGSVLQVAVEGKTDETKVLSGTSGNYIKVYFSTELDPERIRGKIISVKAESRYRRGLLGSLVQESK